MSQDNSARIPISLFTISTILLAAANRTTLNDEIQTRHFTATGAQSSASPNVSAPVTGALGDVRNPAAAAAAAAAGDVAGKKGKHVTINSNVDIISHTDDNNNILETIQTVIDSSTTFEDLQKKLRDYGITITPETISINIRQK